MDEKTKNLDAYFWYRGIGCNHQEATRLSFKEVNAFAKWSKKDDR
jgi:hypothetical protein